MMRIRITNRAPSDLKFVHTTGRSNDYRMDVYNAFGSIPEKNTDDPLNESTQLIRVPPGQLLDERADLTKEYDLSVPGTYHVQAAYGDIVKSNIITVTVTP